MARRWQSIRDSQEHQGNQVLTEGRDVQDEIDGNNQTVDVELIESGSLGGQPLNENEVLIIDDGEDE